jgi:tRNA nucleotidyltransferase (CCA-adding enzyme)
MPHLLPQFEKTLENIEPSGEDKENAPQAHMEVRGVLEQDEELLAYGIDASLIGSYSRQVSIRRMQDVDVFSKVPDVPAEMESRDLHAKFAKVLRDSLPEERVAIKDRSVQVRFPDFDLYVDVVPARPTEILLGDSR